MVCLDLKMVCKLLKIVCGGMQMAYEDRNVIYRTIEDVLVKLEDSILYRLPKIFFLWKN